MPDHCGTFHVVSHCAFTPFRIDGELGVSPLSVEFAVGTDSGPANRGRISANRRCRSRAGPRRASRFLCYARSPAENASSRWQSEGSLLFADSLLKHDPLAARCRIGKFVVFLFVLIVLHVLRHQRIGFNFAEFALDQIAVAVRVFVHDHPTNDLANHNQLQILGSCPPGLGPTIILLTSVSSLPQKSRCRSTVAWTPSASIGYDQSNDVMAASCLQQHSYANDQRRRLERASVTATSIVSKMHSGGSRTQPSATTSPSS